MAGETALFYDGLTARRHQVTIGLGASELIITDHAHAVRARWPFADLRLQDAPPGRLRLAAVKAPELARVEISDQALIKQILRRCPQIAKAQRATRTDKAKIVFWSVAAAASLIFTAVYLVPRLADELVPLIPVALERRLGDAVDNQVQMMIGSERCSTPEGDAALATLHAKLRGDATLPVPVEIAVLHSRIPNAFALPGGRVYLLSGLLNRAQHVNEVAGVLAHEIGHVAHRDGLRTLLQSGATSFLIGLLFGDVVGGGTLILVSRTLVESSHTREAETQADAFAAERMLAQGHSPAPLAEFLARLTKEFGGEYKALAIFSSHPLSEERAATLSQLKPEKPGEPLLNDTQWQALKMICATYERFDTQPQPDAK